MKERGATVLVVDGGGRGTTLVHKYSQSPHVDKIVAVPGNDWMSKISEKQVAIYPEVKTTDTVKIANLCRDLNVDLVDVAQDNAVQAGLVNMLKLFKIPTIGPTREAGKIEWDKNYARVFGEFFGLPQPKFTSINASEQAEKFLDSQENTRWYVKASGLAGGKGAIQTTSRSEVLAAIKHLKKEYPNATDTILIEQWLEGEEFSAFAVSDSRNFKILGYAQDHKKECDGDKGENTGGMGAVSHPLLMTPELMKQTEDIFEKAITGLRESGKPYRGILYLGGIVVGGKAYIIEFNARWGDPEAQVIVPGLKVDLFEMGTAVTKSSLKKIDISEDGKVRVAVAGVAKGYPREDEYKQVKGKQIFGLDEAAKVNGVTICGAAVKIINGNHYADGGRLFYVIGEGETVLQARERVTEAFEKIKMEDDNLRNRGDIGYRDMERLRRRGFF